MSLAREFWNGTTYAVLGVHAAGRTLIPMMVQGLEGAGKTVWLADPSARELKGREVHASLEGAPALDGALIVSAPGDAAAWVEACLAAGVTRIWFDTRGDSSAARGAARAAGVGVVGEACPFMTMPDVWWGHRMHGWIAEKMGKLG